jgi:ABC-type spermidine/putrescine transport system permease subunit II
LHLKLGGTKVILWTCLTFVSFFVVVPSFYLLLWAFNGTPTVGVLSSRFTLAWFNAVLDSPQWRSAIIYSLVLGAGVSAVGVAVLIVHFYSVRYVATVFDRIAYAVIMLVVLLPPVVYALALRIVGGSLGLPEMLLVAGGHLMMVLPLQYFVFESAQEGLHSDMLFAGSTLGAGHLRNIRTVYIPLIPEAIVSAFLVGLFTFFDELVVATFVIDSPRVTVPRKMWDQITHNMDPTPAVISLLLIGLYLVAVVIWGGVRVIRRERQP